MGTKKVNKEAIILLTPRVNMFQVEFVKIGARSSIKLGSYLVKLGSIISSLEIDELRKKGIKCGIVKWID